MITELDIYNFQSWEEGHFVFHPGVNVIVGDSDMGKSAMLRSIRWVIWNRPSGTTVKSWWGGPTSVELVTPEGIVIRSKDKEDIYKLGISGRKDMVFKAFGLSVPPEVNQLLDISEVNFQKQIDQPFLLSQTPGERAIYFNRIAKLDKIDIGLTNINSWIRDLTSTIGSPATKDKSATGLIKQIEDATEELTKFDHLDMYEADVEVLEVRGNEFIRLINRKDSLRNLIESLDEVETKIEKESDILVIADEVSQVIDKIHDVRYKRNTRHDLSLKIQALDWIDEQIEEKKTLALLEGKVVGLLVSLNQRRDKIKLFAELTALSRRIKILDSQIDEGSNTLIKDEEYFKKNFPEVCVLCGQDVEKWKPIEGYELLYCVSSIGRIGSYYHDATHVGTDFKLKEQSLDQDGYKRISLYDKKGGKDPVNKSVARLVLEAFIGPCPPGKEASHLDNDRTNNRLSNLLWESHAENEERKKKFGTRPKAPNAKLTEEDVLKIRQIYDPYKTTQKQLSEMFGVSEDSIYHIINEHTWKDK